MTYVSAEDVVTEIACCPVCGAEGASRFTQRDLFCELEGVFGQRHCSACNVFFLSPRVPENQIYRYYPDDYSGYQQDAQPPLIRKLAWALGLAQRRRRILEKFLRSGRILDVGCGNGFFLHTLAGRPWETHAMDVKWHGKFKFDGEFHEGLFDHQPPPLENLDAVTLWHVFEHFYHPRQALANAAAVLRPGGLLLVAVPDLRSIERYIFGRCWVGWDPPRHIATYSRSALETLLRSAGFKLIKVVPDVCTGELLLLNAEFVLRSRGFNSKLRHALLLRLAFSPLTFALNRLGLAPAKVYVASK